LEAIDDKVWRSEFNTLAGAATIRDGQFLLLRRSARETLLPNIWGIPAGRVNYNEDCADACLRELEETGLKGGGIVELVGYSYFASKRGTGQLRNVQLNFLVEVTDDQVVLDSDSHSAFLWIPMNDVDNNLLDPFTREITLSVYTYLGQTEIQSGKCSSLGRSRKTSMSSGSA
jgi:ADP-ribose pyrophosphatase YjhB (NUDIX family)